jgi:threonine dehydrogenase-like Zn-dependent dehydrogenase
MRAFVQTAVGKYEERDIPVPPGRVLERGRLCSAGRADLRHRLETAGERHPRISLPVTMGHEACGRSSDGEGVANFRVGDRGCARGVGALRLLRRLPRRGRANLCALAHADRHGGLRGIPARARGGRALQPAPSGGSLSDEVAAFLDPLASVVHGWNRLARRRFQETLLIYGAGAVGLLWAATARARGEPSSPAAGRRVWKPPRGYGAQVVDVAREPRRRHRRRRAAVDCTGDPRVWELCLRSCAPAAGSSSSAAAPRRPRSPPYAARLHYSEISLAGSFHYAQEARAAMAALGSAEVDPRPRLRTPAPSPTCPGSCRRRPVALESATPSCLADAQ